MKLNDIIFNKFSLLVSTNQIKPIFYKSKDILFKEGDSCNFLCYILEGEIEITTSSYNGNQEVISIIKEHDFFGQYILFQDNGKYLGEVIANKPTKIIKISKDTLLNIMMSDKSFLDAYISLISNESFNIKQQVKLLSHKNALDRVIFYLENNSINNECHIDSVSSLAKNINLPRETVSRILSKLENNGFLIKNKNHIIIKK